MPKGIPTSGTRKPGAGSKPKYSEATKTVAFRIPISKEGQIKELVKTFLDLYKL